MLSKFGLRDDLIPVWQSFVNDKLQVDAVGIFDSFDISRERIDSKSESNVLIRDNGKSYDVSIEIVNDEFLYFCTCSHRSEAKACAHAGAVLIHKMLKSKKNDFNSRPKTLLAALADKRKSLGGINYFKELFPSVSKDSQKNMIYFNFEDFSNNSQLLRLQRGVIKNDGSYSLPMKFTGKDFDFNRLNVSGGVRRLLSFIITGENFGMGYASGGFSKSRFYDVNTDYMMPLFKDLYFLEQELILGATFAKENFRIRWDTSKNSDSTYTLKPFFVSGKREVSLCNMELSELGMNSLWVFDNKKRCFYQHKECSRLDAVKNIVRFPKELVLTESELKDFFSKYYQDVLDSFEFKVSDDFNREEKSVIPLPKLYLERKGVKILVNLRFDYAGREVDYFSKTKDLVIVKENTLYDVSRDLEEEDRVAELLNDNGVVTHKRYDEFRLEEDLIDFVVNGIPNLKNYSIGIFGEENLFNFKISKGRPGMMLEVKNDVDWFDIKGEIRFGKDRASMEKVLEAVFQNKRFVDLGDNKKGVIPVNWISELRAYRGFFKNDDGSTKLSKYHVSVLESLINLSKNTNLDKESEKALKKFRSFEKISEVEISKNITANLRDYQKKGYDWLNFLKDYDFNGILADDMGLGKTLQALCLLQKIKDDGGKKPSLIIVPTSLIFNWNNEIKKFSPKLKAYLHHGSKRVKGEKNFASNLKSHDLIITSYGILKNDLALFAMQKFDYVILDEAHSIKNPLSVNARSVNALCASHKLAISGTPIQNNLMELWSLFNFLSPGYLGSYDSFKENFVLRIEGEKDEATKNALKRMVDPFLLKRSKDIISSELPPKTELVLRSNFGDDEKLIYNNWKDYYSSEISSSIKANGLGKSRLKILEGLTKLRQVCLHPRMVDSKYVGSSAKFDLLVVEVEKVLSEGHKVLIFSSFVKMLTILQEELQKKGIKYSYLDGASKNREKIVREFEESKTSRPFLISIKAGGVGLNLTSADYVFVVDPWWNPAVEMQAMDRAHRIGQKKPVFVYKMIADGSIEEKILELQKSKKKLVTDIIHVEKGIAKEMDVKMIKEIFG